MLPSAQAPESSSVPVDYQRLVDSRLGVVLGLHRKVLEPDEPQALISFHGLVNNSRKLGLWYGDRISLGMAFYRPEAAQQAAIGEAVERYCGNFIPRGLKKSSYRDLKSTGQRAVDPESLALYSSRQYAARGFPFVPFHRDLDVYWVRGRELASGAPAWVPASLVYPNYFIDSLAQEPKTNFANLAGIATGVGREDAERSALEEVIERDAVTVWWLSKGSPVALDLESDDAVISAIAPALQEDCRPLRFTLFSIENVFGVPVLAALMEDPKNDLVTLGFACRPSPQAAALKALAEAVHLRGFSREMLQPTGKIWQLMEGGVLNRRVYKPYRRDRTYLDAYRSDFRDVVDLGCHAQIYLDPRMRKHLARFRDLPAPQPLTAVTSLAEPELADLRDTYLRRLAAEGLQAYSVDVTTPDVASTGLAVVRVLVPGLLGNAPAAFSPLGSRRLYEDPVRLGHRRTQLAEDELELAPMPHT